MLTKFRETILDKNAKVWPSGLTQGGMFSGVLSEPAPLNQAVQSAGSIGAGTRLCLFL